MSRVVMRLLSLLAVVALAGPGCGYSLAGRGSFLPASIKTIGVPMFANNTPIFQVEQTVTERVRAELIGRGKYKVLPQDTDVDALILGGIQAISLTPSAFNDQQQATRYTVTVTARIEFREVATGRVLWENPAVVLREEYEVTSVTSTTANASEFFGQSTNSLERLASDFARTVVSSILEAF
jgi:hypothetical protein